MKYLVLGPALADLEHIENWVAGKFGERTAAKTRRELNETFVLLASFQRMGHLRPEVIASPIRFFLRHQNWIVYRPGNPLLIHRIIPARTDIRNLTL